MMQCKATAEMAIETNNHVSISCAAPEEAVSAIDLSINSVDIGFSEVKSVLTSPLFKTLSVACFLLYCSMRLRFCSSFRTISATGSGIHFVGSLCSVAPS